MNTENKLHIKLSHIEPQHVPSKLRTLPFWGEVKISHIQDGKEQMLLVAQWNLDELIESFIDRIATLDTNTLPKESVSRSLAQQLDELTQRDYDNDDEEYYWSDLLYNFRWTHSLRLWLRGALIPEIIIGQRDDTGEVSCAECSMKMEGGARYKRGDWSFKFNFEDFLLRLRAEAMRFLEDEIKINVTNELMLKRAKQLLDSLKQN